MNAAKRGCVYKNYFSMKLNNPCQKRVGYKQVKTRMTTVE